MHIKILSFFHIHPVYYIFVFFDDLTTRSKSGQESFLIFNKGTSSRNKLELFFPPLIMICIGTIIICSFFCVDICLFHHIIFRKHPEATARLFVWSFTSTWISLALDLFTSKYLKIITCFITVLSIWSLHLDIIRHFGYQCNVISVTYY